MDGTDAKKEIGFDAWVVFANLNGYVYPPNKKLVKVNQNNKSVGYNQSTMVYFNKKGVFKYDLVNRKKTTLSKIQAIDMTVTKSGIELVDAKGKKHNLK